MVWKLANLLDLFGLEIIESKTTFINAALVSLSTYANSLYPLLTYPTSANGYGGVFRGRVGGIYEGSEIKIFIDSVIIMHDYKIVCNCFYAKTLNISDARRIKTQSLF